ncbi:MAG: AAA family ATPase, partial [Oscillospiraceae bacterium]|nr:AAA family ATPase [Oscillospiraceae bacterium]
AIARALAQEPQAILLDEPTAHLDFGNQIRIVKLVQMLSSLGYAVVMTTHDPNQAIMLGGKLAILDRTGTLTVGCVSEMMSEQSLCALYDTELRYTYVETIDREAVLAATPKTYGGDEAC